MNQCSHSVKVLTYLLVQLQWTQSSSDTFDAYL